MLTESRMTARARSDERGFAIAAERDEDDYRVKLYKVASHEAREERERLRLEWDARNRERG